MTLGLDDSYREHFPEVGNILEVTRKEKREELNAKLVARIRAGELERMWLAVPEAINWETVGGFRYSQSGSRDLLSDIHFRTYLDYIEGAENTSIEALKRHHVVCFSAETDAPSDTWSVYKCIYSELDTGEGTFLLDNGRWFRVDAGLVEKVNDEISSDTRDHDKPSGLRRKHARENYNEAAVVLDPTRLALMDRNPIVYGGGKSSVEFCDIFSKQGTMLHVKKYSGSSVLSHLFAQGVTSASLFLGEVEFRKLLNDKLPASHKLANPEARPIPSNYEVAYAIASRSTGDLVLPFFSRVILRSAFRNLRNLGFKVSCTKIQIVE